MSDAELKQHLADVYQHMLFNQQILAELSVSMRAMIQTLKARDPGFWPQYEVTLRELKSSADAQEERLALQRIERIIRELKA